MIDELVVDEYLALIGASSLDPKRYKIVQLDRSDVANRIHELENRPIK